MGYALITGGGKGIGKAIALELASKGFDILIISRTEEDLQQVCAEIKKNSRVTAQYFVIDLSREHAIEKVFSWVQSLHIEIEVLINNAGYGLSGYFEKQDLSALKNMMQLNMFTLVNFTHTFLPQLKRQKRSFILNIASTAAYQATPGLSTYAATKSFVLSFSRGLNSELKNTSVSVTCISPGPTNTGFFERAHMSKKGQEMVKKVYMETQVVAKIAVRALLKGKPEIIPGLQNKLAAFLSWLFPKSIVEKIAGKLLGKAIGD